MSDASATASASGTTAARFPSPVGMDLMEGGLPPELERDIESVMEEVSRALEEAMGAGAATSGTKPVLQPESESDPVRKQEAKRQVQQSPSIGGMAGMALATLGDRIRRKRAQNVSSAVQTMFRATVAYEISARAYNDLARARAPSLYADVAKHAAATGQTERQVLANVMNTAVKDPSLEPLRAKMKKLSDDPEMVRRRRDLHEMARRFEDRAMQVSRWVQRVDLGDDPDKGARVGNAASRLRSVLDKGIGARVARMPGLDAQAPSLNPDSALSRFKAGMGDIAKKIEELVQKIQTFVASVTRRV